MSNNKIFNKKFILALGTVGALISSVMLAGFVKGNPALFVTGEFAFL